MGSGRSHEFNPETSDDKTFSRSVLRDNKEKVAQDREPLPDEEKISYGKKFSQTEELYAVRQMNRELEELARHDGRLEAEGAPKASPKAKASKAAAKAAPVRAELPDPSTAQVQPGTPIGALPPASEPPPRARLMEVVGDATRYVGMIRGGVRDITTAAVRLARLPVEVAILAAQRLRPLKA